MNINQLIEAGHLIPAIVIEQGKVYMQVVSRNDGCPMINGDDTCICKEVISGLYEYVQKRKKIPSVTDGDHSE